ncbi:MAG: pseudoazurin [Rickettsiales bacterium]|nr:pseudoazurin [Rickettsiales bacterium]|tara:strand:- start:133 stop:573 length:441 start_codon:yes stop_codon:yes gene_type:complete
MKGVFMKFFIISILSFIFTSVAFCEEIVIDMLNKRDDGERMVYSQDVAKVAVGDVIKWVPKDGGHNVEFVAGPDGFEIPPKSYLNKEVTMQFDIPGVYLYICSPHSIMGMIGIVIVGDDISNKDAIASYDVGGKGSRKLKKLLDDI